MKLWTIQPVEVWELLNKQGYFICDARKSVLLNNDFEKNENIWGFKQSYDWLIIQMEKMIGKRPKGVKYPIWAWYKYKGKNKKPDLRESAFAERGTRAVCIELDIPDERVVLSDHDAWHYVLNNAYMDNSTCAEEWDRYQNYYDSLSAEKRKILREKSWHQIFDVSEFESDWMIRGKYVQATFWVLYLKDVVKYQYFICK